MLGTLPIPSVPHNTHHNMTLQQSIRHRLRRRAAQYLAPSQMARIRWEPVIAHLADTLPGSLEDYEIDHVYALTLWDLDDPRQVACAFGEANHQWLRRGRNRSKGCGPR